MKTSGSSIWVLLLALGCSAAWCAEPGASESPKQETQPMRRDAGMAAASITQDEEMAIGRQIAGDLLGAAPLVRDSGLQKYVNNVGHWVASHSERPDLLWRFAVIDSKDIYSFSAPGGYVFITRGLYSLLQSESELAGVLGHEIGHVVRRHYLQILQPGALTENGGTPARDIGGGNSRAQSMIGSGAEIVSRPLSPDAEFEADRIGVVLAARAGYDPFGLPAVLQEIGRLAGDDRRVALLSRTHPAPEARLDALAIAMDDRFDAIRGPTLEGRLYRLKR
jgi:predicted Zn-dependent protease